MMISLIRTPFSRAMWIAAIMAITMLYANYQKRHFQKLSDSAPVNILQVLPSFEFKDLGTKKQEDSLNLLKGSNGLMVHFWGTWCAPCEKELPSFVNFAKSLERSNIRFLLLASGDKEKKVRKFLKRFSNIPQNIVIGLDNTGGPMEKLGTIKLPETYLFSSKGKHLYKFSGPQDWELSYYKDRVEQYLGLR